MQTSVMRLLLALLILSTSVRGQTGYDDLSTIKTESEQLTHSLISSGIDTVVNYYYGNAACPRSVEPVAYVYWTHHGTTHLTLFKEIETGRGKKRHTTFEQRDYLGTGIPPYPLYFFEKNYDKIQKDTLVVSHSNIFVFNYAFEAFHVKAGCRDLTYTVNSSNRNGNLESYKFALIDNFRSFLLSFITAFELHN